MGADSMIDNIANHTDRLIRRVVCKPFEFSRAKVGNKKKIDIVGDRLTEIRGVISLLAAIIIVLVSNTDYFSEKYVTNILDYAALSNDIFIAVFGVVLVVFSITTTLWGSTAVKAMVGKKGAGNLSVFEEVLISYISILTWSLLLIILNFLLVITGSTLPDNFSISALSPEVNTVISSLAVGVYTFVTFNIFIYNFDLLYNLYTATVVVAYLEIKGGGENGESGQ